MIKIYWFLSYNWIGATLEIVLGYFMLQQLGKYLWKKSVEKIDKMSYKIQTEMTRRNIIYKTVIAIGAVVISIVTDKGWMGFVAAVWGILSLSGDVKNKDDIARLRNNTRILLSLTGLLTFGTGISNLIIKTLTSLTDFLNGNRFESYEISIRTIENANSSILDFISKTVLGMNLVLQAPLIFFMIIYWGYLIVFSISLFLSNGKRGF